MSSHPEWFSGSRDGPAAAEDGLSNGACEVEAMVALHCPGDGDQLSLSNDGISEFSNSDLSLPEVCVSTNSTSLEEDMSYEVQQAYRIFTGFLLDKNKGITGPFLNPVGHQEAQHGVGGVRGRGQSLLRQSMCLRKMEEKFSGQEYETITEFVTDFRLMLENCYRYHGVDHWISKQAQKLELMLEQKLTLLSRTLREKTTLAVTSKGRFGAEEDRGSTGTTTRRRTAPRSLATLTISGHESVMVQALRLEEQQRAKEEKRQRELEKKEAEEMSAKEVEEWEQDLLSQASPQAVDTLWELPAVGHFLCLAQTALNLPEVVFFELERCLLMPRCSLLLSKIMSSLLSPTPRRATLHRRPALPYHRWEAELRQQVAGWYRTVGASRDQPRRAEQLGLCHQFFRVLGEVSPLEVKPFHLLPFYQRVWLLKGLCDHVYETQKDVQDAVLAQPIHECRESILGYDSKENAYIHFPHFCGADLRIYCQSPSTPPAFPFPSVWVRQVEKQPGMEGEESDGMKDEEERKYGERYGVPMDTEECSAFGQRRSETLSVLKKDKGHCKDSINMFESWSRLKKEVSDSDSCEDSKIDLKTHNSLSVIHISPSGGGGRGGGMEIDSSGFERQSKRFILKQRQGFFLGSLRTIKAETQEPCLNVGEHSYTGRSPARSANPPSPTKALRLQTEGGSPSKRRPRSSCSDGCESSDLKSEEPDCCHGSSRLAAHSSPENTPNSSEEKASDKIWTKKRRRKKKQRGREQLLKAKGENEQRQPLEKTRMSQAVKAALRKVSTNMKRKGRKKKHKTGRKPESSKKINEPPVEPSFKLVCSSLEELRDLISKTEDELDDLESTKKRLGRWYYRREAVKDLHSTLIRLLNELSPWEPKLIKAHQRNRLRLKKEFDDFKKQPEYNNFVREECISSSSDEDEDDEVKELGKDVCSPTDRLEEEDLEHLVPRGLWSGANTREFGMELPAEHHLKHPEKDVDLLPRVEKVSLNMTPADSKQPELSPTNQSRDSASVSPRSPVLHPPSALPKGYTPIPTLLAKSVGNKVTLMKRPADFPGVGNVDAHSQGPSLSLPNLAAGTTNPSKAQSPLFDLQQGPAQTQALSQPRTTAALPQSTQTKPMQSVPKNPIQVLYKVPEGLGHLVKDSSSPIRFSVQPVVDHNTGEKILQQVVILPPNLLIHKAEAKATPVSQQQSKGIQVAVPKVASPLCLSTDVPGFSIPENRIPVQQVAPLRDSRTVSSPPPSVLTGLQQRTISTAGGVKACSVPATKSHGLTSNPPPITSLSTALSTEPIKAADLKQELKTVCIRDSQSILVTTRGGNTGIVKVQTSSDQSGFGSFPSGPVINISPQFKAFLVSKTSPTLCPPAPSQTPPSSLSVTHSQKQTASMSKPPSTVTIPIHTAVSGNIPITAPGSHSAGSTVAITQGSLSSVGPTVGAKITQRAQTSTAGSQTQTPVPLLSRSNIPQLLTQEFVSKTGLKRASTDEGSQVSKFILVTPSSSSASNVALPRGPAPSAQSVPSSRVMIIGQPTVVSSTTLTGSIPKQPMATAPSGQAMAATLPSHTLKMGFGAGPPPGGGGSSEPSSQARNITPPSGFQIQLSGKMTTIGQSIGALSFSPSKCKPVSGSDSPTANGPIPVTSLNPFTSCSSQLGCHGSLTSSSQLRGIPSLSTISHTSCSTPICTVPTLPAGNSANKDPSMLAGVLSNSPAAESSPAQTVPDSWHSFIQSGIGGETISASASSQLARNKIPTLLPSAPAACTPFTASASGTVQQRIVINTSTPLAAGTQILLNNACFVVPPQGLGPGSHVLIISSPAPPQVPTAASATSSGASVPYRSGHPSVAPLAPVLPQSGAGLPAGPAVTSPFVSPSLLSTAPHVTPVKLTGAAGLSSAPLPSNTNVVSALPRSPAVQAGNFASPAVDSHTLGSPLLKLGSLPAPVATSASAFSSARAAVRLPAATQAACPSAALSTVASTFSHMPGPLSSLPVLPSPSTVALPVPALLSSAAAPEVAATPASHCSLPTQQLLAGTSLGPGILPLQDAVGAAAPSTGQPQALVHIRLGNTPVKKQAPAMQTVLSGTRTQVLPTVAVPPIVSAASRIQTLPVATVPPIGSTVNTTETAPVGTVPSSNTTVAVTPAQPITSLKTNSTINPSVDLSSQGCGKLSAQTSVLAVHANMASRLLISPDGAVLSIVQSHVGSPELTANSPTGAFQTHDSSLQPIQSDTK